MRRYETVPRSEIHIIALNNRISYVSSMYTDLISPTAYQFFGKPACKIGANHFLLKFCLHFLTAHRGIALQFHAFWPDFFSETHTTFKDRLSPWTLGEKFIHFIFVLVKSRTFLQLFVQFKLIKNFFLTALTPSFWNLL